MNITNPRRYFARLKTIDTSGLQKGKAIPEFQEAIFEGEIPGGTIEQKGVTEIRIDFHFPDAI